MNKKSKFVDAAQKHLQKGAYDKAIKELQKLLDEDPRDVRTLLKIGDIYAKKGDGAEATKTYRRVAEAYSEQGFFLKAVAVYKQILKHEPQNLEVALKLAELYEHLGVMQEAMVQYQIVASILDSRGNTREWLGVLQRMVELEPENVASRVRYAEGLSREQRADEAVAQFERACELLEQQGRTDDWAKVAERLVFLAPARFDVLKRLARHYMTVGDLRRAITRLEPCFRALPTDLDTLTLLGRAFREAEHTNKAVYIYKELAKVHADAGRTAESRRTYQMVLELDPADADAARALGAEPVRGSNRPAAATTSPKVELKARGSNAPPPRAASSGIRAAPARAPSKARGSAPAAPRTSLGGGGTGDVPRSGSKRPTKEIARLLSETDVYVKYGLRDKALEHLKKITEMDPDAIEAFAKMRDLHLSSNDRPRAADALAYMVRAYTRQGDTAAAERTRGELAALVPGHPMARPGAEDFSPAGEDDVSMDSIDIDVADEGSDPFELGPAPVAQMAGAQDTSDLLLDDARPEGSAESLEELDILHESPARADSAIHRVRGEAPAEDESGFGRVGTDVDGLGTASAEPEVDADSLFEGERSPSPVLDTPLSADAITGAIAVVSPSERPSDALSERPSAAPGDAELLSLLEGGEEPRVEVEDDPSLEEDLQNVEFLLAQGLHEDAREAVLEILKAHPLHPRAVTAFDAAETALGLRAPGARPTVEPQPDVPGARAERLPSLDASVPEETTPAVLDDAVLSSIDPAETATARPDTNGSLAHAAEDELAAIVMADAELTRGYELQQRGLWADAIAAYDAASRVPARAAQAYEMLGICLQQQGDIMGAVTAFYRALESGAPPDRAPRLKYEIGIACETQGDLENALAWYLAAYADDPTQPHLRARIENLGTDPDAALMSATPAAADGVDVVAAAPPPEPDPGPAAPARPARRNKISYI